MKSIALSVLFLIMLGMPAQAQIETHQATFIFNFSRLIQWPNIHSSPVFTIAVLGRNHPLTAELKTAAQGRNVGGREIAIVEHNSVEDLQYCHMLFVPNNRLNQIKSASDALTGQPTLIITESQGRIPDETIINMYLENSRLGFRLNEENARKRNLQVSTQLLNFSR
ncbi:YfiR family protein [Alkaliflexus imshenetskii]|uniref:YfiR family protein n=1 Tax=Alkaliflexus imshenetskii TaxID=286730 RepID=UPI00047A6B74|nr:YfiR family protein [Alkaliflexus imshenetskii]